MAARDDYCGVVLTGDDVLSGIKTTVIRGLLMRSSYIVRLRHFTMLFLCGIRTPGGRISLPRFRWREAWNLALIKTNFGPK